MKEYILTPRLGYGVEDAVENTSYDNAVIEVFEYGVYKTTYPVLPLTMRIFKPQPPPQYQRHQRVVLREGEKVLKKPIPEDVLTTDINPFFQIIQRIVKSHEEAPFETIVRLLIHDKRVFEETVEDFKIIEALVNQMHEDGLLISVKGKYRVGIKISLGDRMVDFVKGYDPFEWEIMEFVEGRGLVSSDEIHRRIVGGLKWTKNDHLIENYLFRLEKRGHIERVGDYYRFKKPLKQTTGEIEKKKI